VIHQDVEIYDTLLEAGDGVRHALASDRKGWVQVVRGAVDVNGTVAGAGDGLAIQDETLLTINSRADSSEILVFDLP
jgi:quercetin 2,3-dioxygenase